MMQKTLSKAISFEGNALHTGEVVKVDLIPSAENTGIVFIRTDLENAEVPALAKYVNRTDRQTILQNGNASVGTVEHLMASLYALGIDNLRVELNGSEVPILDGSAAPLVDLILEAGMEEQSVEKNFYVLEETFTFKDEDGSEIMATLPISTPSRKKLPAQRASSKSPVRAQINNVRAALSKQTFAERILQLALATGTIAAAAERPDILATAAAATAIPRAAKLISRTARSIFKSGHQKGIDLLPPALPGTEYRSIITDTGATLRPGLRTSPALYGGTKHEFA